MKAISRLRCFVMLWLLLIGVTTRGAATFSVASYNVENYLAEPGGTRPAKPVEAKDHVRESIRTLKADVLALQEIGGTNALLELRASLKAEGLDYPHWELVTGADTNIHVAVLSRFPFTARRPHTNDNFLLNGRRFRVSRGFAEVDVQVTPRYQFTLVAAHLKSKRPVPEADQAELREQEAVWLRKNIDARLTANPNLDLIVVGDLNDTRDTKAIKTVIGRGKRALIDTRPAERNGAPPPTADPSHSPRNVTWTYHYGKEDTYSRIDYLLISRGLAHAWETNGTFVLALPNWGAASDHRPIIGSFRVEDK